MPTGSRIPSVSDFLPQGLVRYHIPIVLDRSSRSSACTYISCILWYHLCPTFSQKPTDWLGYLFSLYCLSYMLQVYPTLLRIWLARGCMICLIFGCSCALSCQLNIRHIPTESGIDFWSLLYHFRKTSEGRYSGKWVWTLNFAVSV